MYVAADEYLSGNVRTKLIIAEAAAKDDPELAVNVEALNRSFRKTYPLPKSPSVWERLGYRRRIFSSLLWSF